MGGFTGFDPKYLINSTVEDLENGIDTDLIAVLGLTITGLAIAVYNTPSLLDYLPSFSNVVTGFVITSATIITAEVAHSFYSDAQFKQEQAELRANIAKASHWQKTADKPVDAAPVEKRKTTESKHNHHKHKVAFFKPNHIKKERALGDVVDANTIRLYKSTSVS